MLCVAFPDKLNARHTLSSRTHLSSFSTSTQTNHYRPIFQTHLLQTSIQALPGQTSCHPLTPSTWTELLYINHFSGQSRTPTGQILRHALHPPSPEDPNPYPPLDNSCSIYLTRTDLQPFL